MKTVEAVRYEREMLEFKVDAYLRSKGWEHTSSTPGCLWLWVKLVKWTTLEFPKKNGRWTKVKHEHLVMTDKNTALSIEGKFDEETEADGSGNDSGSK